MAIDKKRFQDVAVSQGTMDLCVTASVFSVLNYIEYSSGLSKQKTDAYSYAQYLMALGADPRRILSGNCDLSEPFKFLTGYKVVRYSSDIDKESKEYNYIKKPCTSNNLWSNIKEAIDKDMLPILATRKDRGFHMIVILEVDNGDISYYDPSGNGNILKKPKEALLPEKDMTNQGGTGCLHLIIEGRNI